MSADARVQKYIDQSRMLANKARKRFRHLHKRFARQQIDVFRLYDWDIPEIRATVDWYAGHLVIGEYTRKQSTPDWLPMMGKAVAEALMVPVDKIHLKTRFYGKADGKRYERLDYTDRSIVVRERDLRFHVNLWDYVDTGLFSDHRNTRQMVREMAAGKDVLNLFCYSGSFSCSAAKGGAHRTLSVDRSRTAIAWARRNMELNGIPDTNNRLVQAHAFDYLAEALRNKERFDLAVVDPPSFYTRRSRKDGFDILEDHPGLLSAVAALMRSGGVIIFSTNHQDFKLDTKRLAFTSIKEITTRTIPEDYVNKRKTIHRCWEVIL
ncbi:MAG: methyltransferase [Desulfobacteraceae bacterium]|nr:methyltransferase [Desulfobacteraceae bacterium]